MLCAGEVESQGIQQKPSLRMYEISGKETTELVSLLFHTPFLESILTDFRTARPRKNRGSDSIFVRLLGFRIRSSANEDAME
jgi:hypothetical protein